MHYAVEHRQSQRYQIFRNLMKFCKNRSFSYKFSVYTKIRYKYERSIGVVFRVFFLHNFGPYFRPLIIFSSGKLDSILILRNLEIGEHSSFFNYLRRKFLRDS